MSKYFKVSDEFLSLRTWISLDQLFDLSYDDLPKWVYENNIVYYLYNTHNGKGYVGETVMSLVDRWRGDLLMNHQSQIKDNPRVLYRALRKYPLSIFNLSIIGDNYDSRMDRKLAEAYWIKVLHTNASEWGYNLTWGGDDNSWLRDALLELYPETNGTPPQWTEAGLKAIREKYKSTGGAPPQWIEAGHKRMLELYPETNGMPNECIKAAHTPEVTKRRMETDKVNHGGKLAIHSDESQEKARLTRIEYYGSGNGRLSDPEVNKRAHDTMEELYGSRMGAAILPENREKSYETQRKNHDGRLAFNTKEAYENSLRTKIKIYGDPYEPLNRLESRISAMVSRTFKNLLRRFESIRSKGLELNSENYRYQFGHRDGNITYYLDYLIIDPRWTNEMTEVLKYLIPEDKLEIIKSKNL